MNPHIPQKPPFQLIDEVVSVSEDAYTTTFLIPENHFFVNENGEFMESGLLENMAQTAAGGTGYLAAQNNTQPPVGYIGQIKNFKLLQYPQKGQTLHTTIVVKHQVFNASIVEGTIKVSDEIIATAELKIFLQE